MPTFYLFLSLICKDWFHCFLENEVRNLTMISSSPEFFSEEEKKKKKKKRKPLDSPYPPPKCNTIYVLIVFMTQMLYYLWIPPCTIPCPISSEVTVVMNFVFITLLLYNFILNDIIFTFCLTCF